jgi:hypothetical protein
MYGDDPASTEMNAGIACHSGFCLFQPVRKKHSTISANNTLTRLTEGFKKGSLAVKNAVNNASYAARSAFTPSFA